MTTKEKLEKKQAEIKELQKKLKDEELAQKKAEEFAKKLEEIKPDISKVVQGILNKAGIELPDGKQIIITTSEAGLITDIVDTKPIRTGTGKGGAKAISFEGQNLSWAKLCDLKNIARTVGGSAHRDVYNKSKELHDSIKHECAIDQKTYPITKS